MFTALTQFFMMFATLFSAGQKTASALDHLATVADESAAAFADDARQVRKQKRIKMEAITAAVAADPQAAIAADRQAEVLALAAA